MLNLFTQEQNSEAIALSKTVAVKDTATISKKTCFSSNVFKRDASLSDSAKSDVVLHIMLLNSEAVHITLARNLCELINLKFARFNSHVLDNSFRKNDKLAFFLNVELLKSENMLQAVDSQRVIDLFLLQSTQQQYAEFYSVLAEFMKENTIELAQSCALIQQIELVHEQALAMNAEFIKQSTKKTRKSAKK